MLKLGRRKFLAAGLALTPGLARAGADEPVGKLKRWHRPQLIALDDQCEPRATGPNVRRLLDEHDVVAIVGNLGTPTAVVTVPIVNEKKTPSLAPSLEWAC